MTTICLGNEAVDVPQYNCRVGQIVGQFCSTEL
jgi:hypothetical protein